MNDGNKVVLYENKNQIFNAAVDKIVVEVFNKREDMENAQLILLTGCSPVAGTTSTCISLGIAAANTLRKVLLIDCDVRKVIKYKKLKEQAPVGLVNYLLQDSEEGVLVEDIIYHTNIDNLDYISCGDYCDNPTRALCSTNMNSLLEQVKKNYDLVLFDFPSISIVPDAQILFKDVDGIVLISALGETRKRQIKDAKLAMSSVMNKYYGMIVNKIGMDVYKNSVRDYDYYMLDKNGEQKLSGSLSKKKYKKSRRVR